jgi:hypothetical protein
VFLDIVQRVQKWLGFRQSGDPNDRHLKQDIRRIVEDLQDHARVQGTRWNQAGREEITKKQVMKWNYKASDPEVIGPIGSKP